MPIVGQVLLHYRIVEKIGEGGMGAVYKAEDTHLDRVVAIKVLPPEKTADPERKRRFVQEAKAASSLNHPNIVVIHDIASDRGLDFIVMEYIQGRTLDQAIGRKGLKLRDALAYAAQIADGLARAHAAGIVHRDLKPTNVMIMPDDRIKILDFGLAKLTEDVPSASAGPTMTLGRPEKPLTEEGYILGTVEYMSPEQAEGRTVDSRSDVFSFGAVLYEMLTGARPFHRETRMATLAAILKDDPKPAAQLFEALPTEVEHVLTRCLRKDPQRRWQNMSDLRVVLQDLKEESDSGKLRPPQAALDAARRGKPRPALWIGLAGLALAAVAAVIIFRPFSPGAPPAPPDFEILRLTFDSGITWSPTANADGTLFAYASDRGGEGNLDIWVQQFAGGPPLRLTTHPAAESSPTFSPDGSRIAFHSDRDGGGIYDIPALGGAERRLAEHGFFPRYSPDGSMIAFVSIPVSLEARMIKIMLVPAQGGTAVVFQPDFNVIGLSSNPCPVWSPDGKFILFVGRRESDPSSLDWWVAPVAGGPAVRTGARGRLEMTSSWQSPHAWAGDDVYFSTGTTVEGVNIFRARIDPRTWQVSGPQQRITSGAGMQFETVALKDGRILYSNLNWTSSVWLMEADANRGTIKGNPAPVSKDLMAKFSFSLSRDGSKMVYTSFGGVHRSRFEVRWKDLAGGEERTLEMKVLQYFQNPRISPDGSVFSYRDMVDGKLKTFFVSGREMAGREACDSCEIMDFYDDPNFALVRESPGRLARQNLATGEKTVVLEAGTGIISEPALATGGAWVAFVHKKPDGNVALYVAPLEGSPATEKEWIPIYGDDRFLGSPTWSPDGALLYFLSARDGYCCVWAQPLDGGSRKPIGQARGIYHAHSSTAQLNYPPNNARLNVGLDKIAVWRGDSTGNVYIAKPKAK